MLRELRRLTLLVIGLIGGLVLGRVLYPPRPAMPEHGLPAIQAVQMLAVLLTTKVEVADVQETVIQGHTGGIKAVLLVRGDFLLGVDLAAARFEKVDERAKTAVLVLPAPTAASPRLDHARSRIFGLSAEGLWQLVPADAVQAAVVNRAFAEAQNHIAQAAADPELIERSRRQAEAVVAAFFRAMGWEVAVRWRS